MEPKKNRPSNTIIRILLLIGVPLLLIASFTMMLDGTAANKKDAEVYSDYIQYFVDDKVEEFHLDLGTGKLKLTLRSAYRTDKNEDGKVDKKDYELTYTVPNVGHFIEVIDPILEARAADENPENDVKYDFKPIPNNSWMSVWLPIIVMVAIAVIMFLMMRRSLCSHSIGTKRVTPTSVAFSRNHS